MLVKKKRILKIKTKKKSSKQTKKQQKRNNKKETTKKNNIKNNIKNINTTVNQTIVGGTTDVIELVLGENIIITKEIPPVIFCEIIIDTKKYYCCFKKEVDYVYFHDGVYRKKYVFFNKIDLEVHEKEKIKDAINAIYALTAIDVWVKLNEFNRTNNNKFDFKNLLYFRKDLTEAKKEIEILNLLLSEKGLKLELDYFYELVKKNERFALYSFDNFVDGTPGMCKSDLTLCLYNSEGCISSIIYNIQNQIIIISSRTTIGCEKKKYNKILRCVSIIISKKINQNIEFLMSKAVNPISVISFCNSFDFIINKKNQEDLFEYMGLGEDVSVINSDNKPDKFNKKIEEFFKKDGYGNIVELYIPLNEENINKAYDVFNENAKILDSNPCAYPNKTSTIISTIETEEESKVQPENKPMAATPPSLKTI